MTRARITAASALLLAGCAVGPDYHRPEVVAVPPAFAEPQPGPGGTVDPATWWTGFNDPLLTGLVERALRDSPDMAVAASRVRQARLQEIVARSAGLPEINANAQATNVRFSKNAGVSSLARLFGGGGGSAGGMAGGTGGASGGGGSAGAGGGSSSGGVAPPGGGVTTYALGFDASWEFDVFGGVRRDVQALRARTESADWNRRDAAVTLAAEVVQGYFALRLDQLQLQILQEEVARQARALQIAGEVSRVGLVPQVDLTRQRSQLTSTRARLEPVTADLQLRIHALGVLLGVPPEELIGELSLPADTLVQPIPIIPAGLPSDLLRRRPDVRAAERNLAAATADIGVAVADLYPRFSLTGMAQLISTALGNLFSTDSIQTMVTGAGQFPVLDWGRRRATVGLRREEAEQAYQRYRQAVLGALRDVEDPLARIAAGPRRNASLVDSVRDAQANARATEAQYRTGFVAQNTLLDAQTQVLTAREQLAESDGQLRQTTVSLFKAIGGGWQVTPIAARPERSSSQRAGSGS